jgi:hypothetical protein
LLVDLDDALGAAAGVLVGTKEAEAAGQLGFFPGGTEETKAHDRGVTAKAAFQN